MSDFSLDLDSEYNEHWQHTPVSKYEKKQEDENGNEADTWTQLMPQAISCGMN